LLSITPPRPVRLSSRRVELPNQSRAAPEAIAQVLSDRSAITTQTTPSSASCSVTWPCERSTNWGSTAVKMISPLGFVAPT
jgi:hypothetical protein